MKRYNIITAILFLVLAGLWFYLGLARQEYYYILSLLSVIVAFVHFLRHSRMLDHCAIRCKVTAQDGGGAFAAYVCSTVAAIKLNYGMGGSF